MSNNAIRSLEVVLEEHGGFRVFGNERFRDQVSSALKLLAEFDIGAYKVVLENINYIDCAFREGEFTSHKDYRRPGAIHLMTLKEISPDYKQAGWLAFESRLYQLYIEAFGECNSREVPNAEAQRLTFELDARSFQINTITKIYQGLQAAEMFCDLNEEDSILREIASCKDDVEYLKSRLSELDSSVQTAVHRGVPNSYIESFNVEGERKEIYQSIFGDYPERVMILSKIPTMNKPTLVEFPRSKLGGFHVLVSAGLSSNISVLDGSIHQIREESSQGGIRVESKIVAPAEKRSFPENQAGYGYELMAISDEPLAPLPKVMNWVISQEVSGEFTYLDVINRVGGVTSGPYYGRYFENMADEVNFLIAPPWGFDGDWRLSNGYFKFFALVNLSAAEMNFVTEQGVASLIDKFKEQEIPPIVSFTRESLV